MLMYTYFTFILTLLYHVTFFAKDIVAVGQSVLSAGGKQRFVRDSSFGGSVGTNPIYFVRALALPDSVGECDPSNGKIPDANGKNDGLLSLQGTSMATPVVAGTAALIRQYFEEVSSLR
jgi:subtilisin family serine protease